MTAAQTAKVFGCTEAQAKAQYAANVTQLRAMLETAKQTGTSRGYTVAQLEARIAKFEALAA